MRRGRGGVGSGEQDTCTSTCHGYCIMTSKDWWVRTLGIKERKVRDVERCDASADPTRFCSCNICSAACNLLCRYCDFMSMKPLCVTTLHANRRLGRSWSSRARQHEENPSTRKPVTLRRQLRKAGSCQRHHSTSSKVSDRTLIMSTRVNRWVPLKKPLIFPERRFTSRWRGSPLPRNPDAGSRSSGT